MAALLEAVDVWFTYPGGVRALRGASLAVSRGEVVALTGPNGCGKTTLLMVSAGLLKPEKGCVLFRGRPLSEQLPGARRSIGLVFQEPDDQLFNATVYDEVAFAIRQLVSDEREVEERVLSICEKLGIDHLLDRPPFALSVGEKKRVALASVLVYEPEVVLLDEPLANLSAEAADEILGIIRELRGRGKAVVVATHDVELIAEIADRVYLMSGGKTLASGPARDVLSREGLLRRAGIRPPRAVEVYGELFGDGRAPLTIRELVELLRSKLAQHGAARARLI